MRRDARPRRRPPRPPSAAQKPDASRRQCAGAEPTPKRALAAAQARGRRHRPGARLRRRAAVAGVESRAHRARAPRARCAPHAGRRARCAGRRQVRRASPRRRRGTPARNSNTSRRSSAEVSAPMSSASCAAAIGRSRPSIDLHGLTTAEAHDSLADFLVEARGRGLRCVRVIHGKGLTSPNREPVLKGKVRGWLAHWDDVLAYAEAPQHAGGGGAVLVLLQGQIRPCRRIATSRSVSVLHHAVVQRRQLRADLRDARGIHVARRRRPARRRPSRDDHAPRIDRASNAPTCAGHWDAAPPCAAAST